MIDETLIKIVRGYESSFWLKVHRTCSLHLLSPLAPQNFIILLQNSLQKSWEEKIILKNCRFIEWVLSRFQSNEKPTRPSRLQVVQWKIAHNLCRFSYNFCSTRILSYFVGIFYANFMFAHVFYAVFLQFTRLFGCLVVQLVRPKMKIVYWFQRAFLCQFGIAWIISSWSFYSIFMLLMLAYWIL